MCLQNLSLNQGMYFIMTYDHVTMKAQFPTRSPKLSSDEPVQCSDEWLLKQRQVL